MKKNKTKQTALACAPDSRGGLRMYARALPSERRQTPQTTYCVIPLIRNVQRQTADSWLPGAEEGAAK